MKEYIDRRAEEQRREAERDPLVEKELQQIVCDSLFNTETAKEVVQKLARQAGVENEEETPPAVCSGLVEETTQNTPARLETEPADAHAARAEEPAAAAPPAAPPPAVVPPVRRPTRPQTLEELQELLRLPAQQQWVAEQVASEERPTKPPPKLIRSGKPPAPLDCAPPRRAAKRTERVAQLGALTALQVGTEHAHDTDGWRLDVEGRRVGTYETWEPEADQQGADLLIAFVVKGPRETQDGAIAEMQSTAGTSLGWCAIARLQAVFGDAQVKQWLEDQRVLWVNHHAALSSPAFNNLAHPGTVAEAMSVPWQPTWEVETIKRLRQQDFSLHVDDEIWYPDQHQGRAS